MTRKKHSPQLIAAAIVCALVGLFALLDDWKRDLTTNYAQLQERAEDPLLRPLMLDGNLEQVASQVIGWAESRPRWKLESQESLADQVRLHFTRRTRVFRFTDDVHVRLSKQGGKIRLDAESQSRFGKGDLGQNPRNLRELTRGVERLAASETGRS